MRGADPKAAEDIKRRVLFLGSSITLGWGVQEDQTMTVLLDSMLGPDTEVLNAGIGNYNTVRYVHAFLKSGKELAPTDVVVHYFVNDAEALERGRDNWILRNSQLAVMSWILFQRAKVLISGKDLVSHYQEVYADDAQGFKDASSKALDLEPGVFTWPDPRDIALSLKRSAERSARRRSDPFRSAMSMLTFYLNRAGNKIDPAQRERLEAAKDELRILYGRPRRYPNT